jgi:hypothetical protein
MSNRRYNTQTRKKFLSGGQAKLDKDGDGKITGEDFAMLRDKSKTNSEKTKTKGGFRKPDTSKIKPGSLSNRSIAIGGKK